jgi:periplasmic divalent cation tolerance protein
MTDLVVCLITAPTYEEAEKISRTLVEKKLAACCSTIKGVVSIYRWEGKTNQTEECQIIAKTTREKLDALVAETKRIHSYDVPEIIALPIVGGLPAYLDWLAS